MKSFGVTTPQRPTSADNVVTEVQADGTLLPASVFYWFSQSNDDEIASFSNVTLV